MPPARKRSDPDPPQADPLNLPVTGAVVEPQPPTVPDGESEKCRQKEVEQVGAGDHVDRGGVSARTDPERKCRQLDDPCHRVRHDQDQREKDATNKPA